MRENLGGALLPRNFKIDSRCVNEGDGFIAVAGARDNGHNYIKNAIESGAVCVLLEREFYEKHIETLSNFEAMFLSAEDTVASAAKLARAWLDEVSPRVIGITGSVGKTTTREFLNKALEKSFRTHSAIKSYNTLIGTAMTVLAMPKDTEILILELGANHPGEISALVEHFPVTHSVITEVTDAHLEGFNDIKGVLDAKMEITGSRRLEYLSYNSDNDLLSSAVVKMPNGEKFRKDGIKQVGVGYSSSNIRISDVRQYVGEGLTPILSLSLSENDRKVFCEAPVFGRQHAKNIAFAYAVAIQMGMTDGDFELAASNFKVPSGRGVIGRGKNGCILLDETYNANPSSVSHAIKNVLEMELTGDIKRIAILGGMRELGLESDRLHEVILSRAALLDEIYLIGSEWNVTSKKYESIKGVWKSADDFIADFGFGSVERAVILLKGSRFYGMERILPYLEG
ncbi:MAG: UDP-N-acetylmuramoyl-tripeptide--D-alanyl-D-alanine ligase [Synergistaceae bacterium]|nr:UDP-N-acetylmuramoyl-tripeptide--D-alanyl-D-alanine ligase [Synergistaceae bacterium]